MTILLCEDDLAQLGLLTEYLEWSGFSVQGFPCADEALAAMCPRTIDAVVTDYHLRGRRGCEIVRAATELKIPSIVVTGLANIEEIARSVNVGVRFVLLKPYEPSDLVERIREAVKGNSARDRLERAYRKIKRS